MTPLISWLATSIHYAVRILAVLMVLVIWLGVADVVYAVVKDEGAKIGSPP